MKSTSLYYVCFLFCIAFLLSCKNEIYIIKGRIVEDCTSNSPVANMELTIRCWGGYGGAYGKIGLNETVTTNENGRFAMAYNTKDHKMNRIFIQPLFSLEREDTTGGWNPKENIDFGDFPIRPKIYGKINLLINNPYTINDTLFIMDAFTDWKDTLLVMPGPFYNMSFGPELMSSTRQEIDFSGSEVKINHSVSAKFNNANYKAVYSTKITSHCEQSLQEFDLVID
ncbi:MAG: hypothetical protein WC044_05010 [Crocinitomicaceae bacterium]